jgi:hypothetical protein
MGDIVGRLFREFAVTLSVTIWSRPRVADADADDGSRLLKHTPEEKQGRFYHESGRILQKVIDFYGRTLKVGAALPDDHAVRRLGHPRADGDPLHHHSQGLLPDPGHRHHPGHLAGGRLDVIHADDAAPAGPGRRCCSKTRRSRASPRSSARTAPTPRSTAAASRSTSSRSGTGAVRLRRDPPAEPEARPGRGHQAVHATGAGPDRRRPGEPHGVSVHARRPQPGRAQLGGARSPAEAASAAELADVVTDQQLDGIASTSPSTGRLRRASASRRRRSTTRCTTPSASGRSTRCTRRSTSIT